MKHPPVLMRDHCPFAGCSLPVPHEHLVCQKCGAVCHGNYFCQECKAQRERDLELHVIAKEVADARR